MALIPFVIDAQAGQSGYRVPLKQLLQADHTFTRIFSQHVICRRGRESKRISHWWMARSKHRSRNWLDDPTARVYGYRARRHLDFKKETH